MTTVSEHRARLGATEPLRDKQDGLAILRGLASMLALTALTMAGIVALGFVLRLYMLLFLRGWGLVP